MSSKDIQSTAAPTTSPANREIVVYALYLLGGATRKCHTEDVALKCFELAPHSFSWTKHTQYPDKDIVRVALTDARKDKYGGLVDGRTGQSRGQYQKTRRQPTLDGWMLTDAGLAWVRTHLSHLEGLSSHISVKEHRQKSLQFLARIRKHDVFKKYENDPDRFSASIGELADLLRCRVDADEAVWRERFERIRKHAAAVEQEEVLGFVIKGVEAYERQR